MNTKVDVAIIGAGPAGASTAISLSQTKLSVALIDKSVFPRDKICGDALSPDVLNQLRMLPLNTGELFEGLEEKLWCKAVRFVAPNHAYADISLSQGDLVGYISPRMDFDYFMFQQAEKAENVSCFNGEAVKKMERTANGYMLTLANADSIEAKMIVGADGANGIVAKQLAKHTIDRNHHCAGLRVYYENVTGFSDENAIELHFYKEFLPGYFWVFPLPGNRANVGVGMLSDFVSKKNINLKERLEDLIANHPNVAPRFKNAKALETIKGFGLPLGSRKLNLSGDHFLLTGDAASLINPLSGEGIGNAIRSGRVAADHLIQAFEKQSFDAKFNKAFDDEIYRRMWGELSLNYSIQRVMRYPALCNIIVKRAIGNPSVQALVMSGFDVKNIREYLTSIKFYKELIFGVSKN